MKQQVLLFLFFYTIILFSCGESGHIKKYKYIGQVSFRKTYAGYSQMSQSELDSACNSNPTFMYPTGTAEDTRLNVLIKLGVANKKEFFINKIAQYLKDTVFIANNTFPPDTVFIQYDAAGTKASIQIKSLHTIDSIPITDEPFAHSFSFVALKDSSGRYVVFLNKYYIMNGDNYEFSLYEKE